ncbi:MAG: hypothetical protein HeimC2_18510 [Candidatus Heimdallarchaeota archaeon LC_2]|nr:MAG: hypothetical protein HeimC2_18510 [Candidatus Heimdallarchaeota archaeon LC_2]
MFEVSDEMTVSVSMGVVTEFDIIVRYLVVEVSGLLEVVVDCVFVLEDVVVVVGVDVVVVVDVMGVVVVGADVVGVVVVVVDVEIENTVTVTESVAGAAWP